MFQFTCAKFQDANQINYLKKTGKKLNNKNTLGKLSQVPPAEVLVIGCDRHPEVPVTVEIWTIKGG